MVRLAESDSLVLEGPSILFEDLPPSRGHDQGCFRRPTGRWWQHGRSRLTVSHAVLRGTHICKALPVTMYGSVCNSAEGLLHCLLQQTASMSGPSPPAAYGLGPISCFQQFTTELIELPVSQAEGAEPDDMCGGCQLGGLHVWLLEGQAAKVAGSLTVTGWAGNLAGMLPSGKLHSSA